MSASAAVRFPGRDARVVVSLSALALLGLCVLFVWLLADKWVWANETREMIEPRHARLLGLREMRAPLGEALAEMDASLARFAYPASSDLDRLGADVQERVRRLASASGLTINGSQILAPRKHAAFVELPLKITVSGSLEGLRELLAGLDRETPLVLVDQLEVSSMQRRVRRGAAPAQQGQLAIQLSLSVLRLQA
ncbi:MAG: type II secretion system protein GspM [Thauera sp.]|jgi:general secretion pathway protein M|nr:type II secretion system protein GspM [Thauera sp.]